jgi:hypothetical protein
MRALAAARAALMQSEEVVLVRPGYLLPRSGAPTPAIVVAVVPGTPPDAIDTALLARRFGTAFCVEDATPDEQLAALGQGEPWVAFSTRGPAPSALERLLSDEAPPVEFAPPRSGSYQPLDPQALPRIDESMEVTICVSPEAGWSELETFLAGVQSRLTVGMYQFTAPHIFRAVRDAMAPTDRTLSLVLHPAPEPPAKFGVKAQDLPEPAILAELAGAMGGRFRLSWATVVSRGRPDGLWASAYHIKVAVRDGRSFWLSSGNWQSSNQPPVRPFGEAADALPAGFQQLYNREYHAIVTGERLAEVFESYIQRDAELIAARGAAEAFTLPDLFVTEVGPEPPVQFAGPPQLFPPLRLSRRVRVQPLLTPDNYAGHTLALIRSATESVWFQNQYINFRNTGEDFPAFQLLVGALRAKIAEGLDVRIICRDFMRQESVDILLALGFPREIIRLQPGCHNKAIIVDGKVAMLGSHNWSNEGVSTNRDASLIFFDEEIARYLARIYEHDWRRLARPIAMPPHWPRVAQAGEPTPRGCVRVPYAAVVDD